MKKALGLMLVFLLALTSVTSVTGLQSFDYFIDTVEVKGQNAGFGNIVLERGETVPVEVWVRGLNTVDGVRVEASLSGYEHGEVEDVSEPMEISANGLHKITLELEIPEDIEVDDFHTLTVRASDSRAEDVRQYDVQIREPRHKLSVRDVIFRPSTTVEAGRTLRAVVLVENLGDKKEENVKVTVSVPELGVSGSELIEELVPQENDDTDVETSESTNEIRVEIPTDAPQKAYDVNVLVEYNRGHDVVRVTKLIQVTGTGQVVQPTDTIVSVDSTSREIRAGEEVSYKVMFANLGSTRALYSVQVVGAETWASVRTSPSFVNVDPSQAGELFVYLSANENAPEGPKVFTVKVNEGAKTIKEVNLNANVTDGKATDGVLRYALEIGFVVLVLVLIVLGLVVAFRRMSNEPRAKDLDTTEEQTYY